MQLLLDLVRHKRIVCVSKRRLQRIIVLDYTKEKDEQATEVTEEQCIAFFFSIHHLKSIYKTRHSNIVSYNILIKSD